MAMIFWDCGTQLFVCRRSGLGIEAEASED